MQPKISVLLPVYNGAKYLKEALESIYNQSIKDIEIIAIDDGSTDKSYELLKIQKDPRLKIYKHKNRGLAATLNRAISLSSAPYLARMDQDDISDSERFAQQLKFLNNYKECAVVGCWSRVWRNNKSTNKILKHPVSNPAIQFALLFDTPFAHSSVMLRTKAIKDVGGYSEDKTRQPPEDFELWSRVAQKYTLANLPSVLHNYREVDGSMSRDTNNRFNKTTQKISLENILAITGDQRLKTDAQQLTNYLHLDKNTCISKNQKVACRQLVDNLAKLITETHKTSLSEKIEILLHKEKIYKRLGVTENKFIYLLNNVYNLVRG